MRVAAQRRARLARRLCQNRAGFAGERDQRPGLHPLQPGDGADVERLPLGDQVDHLAADHAGAAGRSRQGGDELAAHRRVAVRVGVRQHLEGHRQQPVAGEDRGRIVELLVAGRPAAAQIAVVHRRQIVVDQRIGMDHLDRRRDLQRAAPRHPEEPRAGQHQERPQPLSRGQRRIAHRLVDPRLQLRRRAQQPVDDRIGQLDRHRRRFVDGGRVQPQAFSQSASAPLNPALPARSSPSGLIDRPR